jgi:hypothetical protein
MLAMIVYPLVRLIAKGHTGVAPVRRNWRHAAGESRPFRRTDPVSGLRPK